ncbi:pimeloyl-ACP methyl ester carboxylesterase [Parvibaculum indicum]|uniref:alpha/beta fold hydrolase n=1 Tax=Parvibaculum indicum TaxID=562969 RepID=UPI00141EC45F|nr:alpha/beta fold hydrolase [Parvibaculum indicum]NIJ41871.1 pimeloyl-ACP methyl ester carboxylesterase [Parvibaculum indicum]
MTDEIQTAFVEANGLNFETDMCGKGEKLALLLHGFPESKFSWRHQLPVFAAHGYTAWAPNLRGYGQSSRPLGKENYTLDHLTDDVAALIDAARARGVTGPVTLVAHDWGGAIAWQFVLQKKRPLERFIVMNLPHPSLFIKGARTWQQMKKSWYILFFQLPWLPEKVTLAGRARAIGEAFSGMAIDKSRFPKDVLEHYRRNALIPGAMTAMMNYYRANFGGSPPAEWKDPPKVDVPTLMIWGEADTALGKELTYGTDKLVTDFTLRYLPEVSHWVQQEAPEKVNAMIAAWLEGKPVPEAGEIEVKRAA